jgi:hypothetical protein
MLRPDSLQPPCKLMISLDVPGAARLRSAVREWFDVDICVARSVAVTHNRRRCTLSSVSAHLMYVTWNGRRRSQGHARAEVVAETKL